MSFVSSIKSFCMKNRAFVLVLCLLFSFLLSCKTARERKSDSKGPDFTKAELVANFDSLRNSASFSILMVSIDRNIMTLDVEFSGGCEEHVFKLYGTEMIQKSLPPKRGIMLWHDNKGDSCRSIVSKQLKFYISAFEYSGGEITCLLDCLASPM